MYIKKRIKERFRYNPEKKIFYSIEFINNYVEINTDEFKINIEKNKFGSPLFWHDLFIISNPNSKSISIYRDGNLVKEMSGFINSSNKDYLILNKKVDSTRSLNILNKDFEIEKTFENGWSKMYIDSKVFIFCEYRNLDILKVYNFKTKNIVEISVPLEEWSGLEGEKNKNRIYQTVGQWKNELLVFIGKFRLLSFDLETGKELWRIDDFIQEVSSSPIFDFPSRDIAGSVKWHLSEVENKAYLLVRNCLFELNLNEKKTRLKKDYNHESEIEWYFKDSKLYDNLITFSGTNTLGMFPNVAGVIDKNTKEVLWMTKCESGVYFEEAPQIKDGKLYVLDSSKTLHIFEKE